MSGWMQVAAYALITVFLGVLLRELGFRGSKLILLLGTVSVIGAAALSAGLRSVRSEVATVVETSAIPTICDVPVARPTTVSGRSSRLWKPYIS